jgi:hypothetical protein
LQRESEVVFGHRLRVINQQKEIKAMIHDMQMRCIQNKGSDEAVITIDFQDEA